MAKQSINLGTAPTGAGGDDRRSAWVKANANFDELYAAVLIETGTNANGRYTKWSDGTMICEGSVPVGNIATQTVIGSLYFSGLISARPFPANFIAPPVCVITVVAADGIASYSVSAPATASASQSVYLTAPSSSGTRAVTVSFIAKGRWK